MKNTCDDGAVETTSQTQNSIKSGNVDRNKHELYFRFLAFNKKKGGKGKENAKEERNKAGYCHKKE
jgi:hypothetical protein